MHCTYRIALQASLFSLVIITRNARKFTCTADDINQQKTITNSCTVRSDKKSQKPYYNTFFYFTNTMKKALRETQTLRTGYTKAEPKIFAQPQTPFPRAQDGQNLISWRCSLPSPKAQFGEDRCTQFRVIVVTDPQTNKHTYTQTGDYNTLHRSFASAQCNK